MKRKMVPLVFVFLASMYGSPSPAQEQSKPGQEAQRTRETPATTGADAKSESNIDHQLANCLAIDNWAEVQLAQFAVGKLQEGEVKQFAEMIHKDHSKILQQLQQFDPQLAKYAAKDHADHEQLGRTASSDRANEQKDKDTARSSDKKDANLGQKGTSPRPSGEVRRDSTTLNAEQAQAGPAQMMEIKYEIAQSCVNTFKKELESKSQSEIDRCFVGYQVGAHMRLLDTLKVFERHASPQLAHLISAASQTTEHHLEQAKRLHKQLETTVARANVASPNVK